MSNPLLVTPSSPAVSSQSETLIPLPPELNGLVVEYIFPGDYADLVALAPKARLRIERMAAAYFLAVQPLAFHQLGGNPLLERGIAVRPYAPLFFRFPLADAVRLDADRLLLPLSNPYCEQLEREPGVANYWLEISPNPRIAGQIGGEVNLVLMGGEHPGHAVNCHRFVFANDQASYAHERVERMRFHDRIQARFHGEALVADGEGDLFGRHGRNVINAANGNRRPAFFDLQRNIERYDNSAAGCCEKWWMTNVLMPAVRDCLEPLCDGLVMVAEWVWNGCVKAWEVVSAAFVNAWNQICLAFQAFGKWVKDLFA